MSKYNYLKTIAIMLAGVCLVLLYGIGLEIKHQEELVKGYCHAYGMEYSRSNGTDYCFGGGKIMKVYEK